MALPSDPSCSPTPSRSATLLHFFPSMDSLFLLFLTNRNNGGQLEISVTAPSAFDAVKYAQAHYPHCRVDSLQYKDAARQALPSI